MPRRTSLRSSAAALTVLVTGLGLAPALAATGSGTATATALTVTAAGQSRSSGTYSAARSSNGETDSGKNAPALPTFGGEQRFKSGVLTQDAITSARDGKLRVTACSGLADSGTKLSAGGRGVTCTKTGDPISVVAGRIDLSRLDPGEDELRIVIRRAIFGSLPENVRTTLRTAGNTFADQLLPLFQADLTDLGSARLRLNLEAVEGRCTAVPGQASGGARITDAGFVASFPDADDVDPVRLPQLKADPAADTKVDEDLSAVADVVTTTLKDTLKQAKTANDVDGNPLQTLIQTLDLAGPASRFGRAFSGLTAPLSDDAFSLVLNQQVRPADGSIRVTALALETLPAAAQLITNPLASAAVGQVTCSAGTSGSAGVSAAVPTRIDSGVPGSTSSGAVLLVLGGLVLLGGAGAGLGVRRVRQRV